MIAINGLDLWIMTNKTSTEGVYKSAGFHTLRQILVISLQYYNL